MGMQGSRGIKKISILRHVRFSFKKYRLNNLNKYIVLITEYQRTISLTINLFFLLQAEVIKYTGFVMVGNVIIS